MNNKKLIVLNFETGKVYVYTYDPHIWDSPEDMLDEYSDCVINSNCQWMLVDKLNIEFHG